MPDPDRTRDVLDRLSPKIGKIFGNPAVDHLIDCIGNAYTARFGHLFQPRRAVDVIAKDITRFDHPVADSDADAIADAAIFGTGAFQLGYPGLDIQRAAPALANSASKPAPVVLTMCPRQRCITGLIGTLRYCF